MALTWTTVGVQSSEIGRVEQVRAVYVRHPEHGRLAAWADEDGVVRCYDRARPRAHARASGGAGPAPAAST